MSVADLARKLLPADVVASLVRARKKLKRARISRLPVLSEESFAKILADNLGLVSGDTVYVHSSVDQLNLGFPFYRVLPLIQNALGPEGTILFPTYPNRSPVSSYEYLKQDHVFDVRRTPSFTGLVTEFARRHRNAIRSLHPTKSVCAIGPNADPLTATHQQSPYPYDKCSPYRKLVEFDAKIIGIGVHTTYLSFVYCVDDELKENNPVQTYYPEIFAARCINYEGTEEIVHTYAHDMRRCVHDIPRFIKQHIPTDICADFSLNGMKFFRAQARPLFETMLNLARQDVTVYPNSVYKDLTAK
jgi:aminoglycoside 3-N-acetyltransferase